MKLERHANIMASLSDSTDAHIAHVAKAAKASELMKKRSHNVFTLGTTVLALRSSNDPQAVAVLNDCMAKLMKKARAALDEDEDEETDENPNNNDTSTPN